MKQIEKFLIGIAIVFGGSVGASAFTHPTDSVAEEGVQEVIIGNDNESLPVEGATTEEYVDPILVLPPLFEYPVAPEDLEWTERSNWLAKHFWDDFDFKQKSVGQSQLIHALSTYIVPLHMADRDVALKSIKELIKKLQKNPSLLYQFTNAAERTMYSPATAELMIDEVYVEFLKALVANKKIPALRKVRYEAQLKSLQNSMLGHPMPDFLFTDRHGNPSKYTAAGVPTIIEFGNFDCSDCRIARLRLETDDELQQLVKAEKARIMFISPDVDDEEWAAWASAVKNYPESWIVGRASGLDDVIDLRVVPCIFIIDAKGNIVTKSANTDTAREYVKTHVAK
ncbi:MAG: DUF5106 domain-containing protein [Muribaculaceae bacterium]|nr:DUF5106 domain-containing protein [Muribaculaceae bacterium]